MACNCATKEQIDALYKKYGERRKVNNGDTFKVKAKEVLTSVGVELWMIPTFIVLFRFVSYKGFFDDDKQISMTKFFRLDKRKTGYVGNE